MTPEEITALLDATEQAALHEKRLGEELVTRANRTLALVRSKRAEHQTRVVQTGVKAVA